MRIEVTETKLYKFDELSETAQKTALEEVSQMEGENWAPYFYMYDAFERVAAILGITFDPQAYKTYGGDTRYKPTIYYSGFWSQGDGASFEGSYEYAKGCSKKIRAYAPTDEKLHTIADELTMLQKKFGYKLTATTKVSGHYVHSNCMGVDVDHKTNPDITLPEKELTQILRDFANWMYKSLETEYYYQTSDEVVKETIEANDWEFTKDGHFNS